MAEIFCASCFILLNLRVPNIYIQRQECLCLMVQQEYCPMLSSERYCCSRCCWGRWGSELCTNLNTEPSMGTDKMENKKRLVGYFYCPPYFNHYPSQTTWAVTSWNGINDSHGLTLAGILTPDSRCHPSHHTGSVRNSTALFLAEGRWADLQFWTVLPNLTDVSLTEQSTHLALGLKPSTNYLPPVANITGSTMNPYILLGFWADLNQNVRDGLCSGEPGSSIGLMPKIFFRVVQILAKNSPIHWRRYLLGWEIENVCIKKFVFQDTSSKHNKISLTSSQL